VATDVHFPQEKFTRATGVDVLNGTEQELQVVDGRIPGIVAKDYPLFIRLKRS